MRNFLKLVSRFAIVNFVAFSSIVYFAPQPPQPQVQSDIPSVTPMPTPSLTQPQSTPMPTPLPKPPLASHNTRDNCWVLYQGQIYNITPYLGLHPGGDGPLLKYCGKDMTVAFDSKDKSPSIPHSSAAKSMLQQYLVK